MNRQLVVAALVLASSVGGAQQIPARSAATVLWYRAPAASWNEALPVGNGRLGAMVFGGVTDERLQLNEDTVWSGQKLESNQPRRCQGGSRSAAFCWPKAASLTPKRWRTKPIISIPRRMPPYQTLGDLVLRFETSGEPTEYRRELDLDTAIARVSFRAGGTQFTREVFASAVDQRDRRARHGGPAGEDSCFVGDEAGGRRVVPCRGSGYRRPRGSRPATENGAARGRAESGRGLRRNGARRRRRRARAQLGRRRRVEVANAATLFVAAATSFREKDPAAACRATVRRRRLRNHSRSCAPTTLRITSGCSAESS